MRKSKAGIGICPPSILAYNAMKQFGSKTYDLPARIVQQILLIDDIISEHGRQEMENAEARSRMR